MLRAWLVMFGSLAALLLLVAGALIDQTRENVRGRRRRGELTRGAHQRRPYAHSIRK